MFNGVLRPDGMANTTALAGAARYEGGRSLGGGETPGAVTPVLSGFDPVALHAAAGRLPWGFRVFDMGDGGAYIPRWDGVMLGMSFSGPW